TYASSSLLCTTPAPSISHLLLLSPLPLPHPGSPRFPYTTLFRSVARLDVGAKALEHHAFSAALPEHFEQHARIDLRSLGAGGRRSEEHTSELQSRFDLVCRLLLEKKKDTWRNT